jgi:hypothetical protein
LSASKRNRSKPSSKRGEIRPVIVDLPDHESAAAVALTVNAAGRKPALVGTG